MSVLKPESKIKELLNNTLQDEYGCLNWQGRVDRDGYPECSYDYRTHRAHRLIMSLLNPKAVLKGKVVRHKCNNRECINPNHLVVGTAVDNAGDRQVGPNAQVGSRHGQAKLNEQQVLEIRRLYATGKWTQVALGTKFKVSFTTISHIVRRNIWTHI